jgi:DNA primase
LRVIPSASRIPTRTSFRPAARPKLDLVNYYLAVSDGALRAVFERPTVLERFPDGALGEPNFGETVPEKRPEWLETVQVEFPSGRSAARPTSSARSMPPTWCGR